MFIKKTVRKSYVPLHRFDCTRENDNNVTGNRLVVARGWVVEGIGSSCQWVT